MTVAIGWGLWGLATATVARSIVVREGVSPRAEIDGKTRCPCSGTVPERVDVVLTPSG